MNNDAQIDYWNGPAGQKWVDQSNRLDAMLVPFADKILETASIGPQQRVLDVGCGAGALTLRATAAAEAGALGVDVSAPLLELAKKRAADTKSAAMFKRADASVFSSDQKFDLLVSRFGVMFFDDPMAAFANIRKQMLAGGRMAFMCWQALPENDWAYAPLEVALPLLKEPPAPVDPTAPGPFAFADKDRVAGFLHEAGWENVSIDAFAPQIILPGDNIEMSAKFMLQIGPLSRLIAAQNLDAVQVEQALIARLSDAIQQDGRVAMRSACWIVTAETA